MPNTYAYTLKEFHHGGMMIRNMTSVVLREPCASVRTLHFSCSW